MQLPDHKTKIVATIGPASESPAVLQQLIQAGMNIARLNFSHGDFERHGQNIENIRAAAKRAERQVAIMADLSGPKMRIGKLATEPIQLKAEDRISLTTEQIAGDARRISVSFDRLPKVVKRGDLLSLNDGYIQLEVAEVRGNEVVCVVKVGGELRSRKGLNLPGIDLGISAFTERDRECLKFALEHGVDAVSQSFVENAADIEAVRRAARELGHNPFIIAKIERSRALANLDEILQAADGVMIARGDLGVEVPIERIAVVQKQITHRANQRAKPVITATQMLESMTTYRLPTRAEATDVANAILDGTDCVMLSGESAMGHFPVEAVRMLARIAAEVEATHRQLTVKEMYADADLTGKILPMHLLLVSVEASLQYLKPAAVFTCTETGNFARHLAAFRFPVWVVAISDDLKIAQGLVFSRGVISVYEPKPPASWTTYVREWVQGNKLPGDFSLLTHRASGKEPDGNYRLEIVNL
ncbi:MAG TPA: pyruvate kinase [Candidatus Limnocylindrales bacterium]|nr:pyruvate kinase [Candidatus Limnocylindrales bacterium]